MITKSHKPRIGESANEIYDYVEVNPQRQIRFNTLGEGFFCIDTDRVLYRHVPPYYREEISNQDFNDLWRWIEKDIVQVEEKHGYNWLVIHSPSGKSFQ
jgi:hypothetical protein